MKTFKLYTNFKDHLPRQQSESEFNKDGDADLMYVASIRVVEDSFRVWACWLESGVTKCFWIRPVWWPCVLSDHTFNLISRAKPHALNSIRNLPQVGNLCLHNADTKKDSMCRVILFKRKQERQQFITLLRKEFPTDPDVGTFEDSDIQGNAECILNRFLCCR